jgi:hypothetical protein
LITGRFVDRVDKAGLKRVLLQTKNKDGQISSRPINDDAEGNQLKTEFAAAWGDYLQRAGENSAEAWRAAEGETSISELHLDRSTEARLRQNGFPFVEQLARMPNAQADAFGVGRVRQSARDFLTAMMGPPDPHAALTEEIKRLRKQLTEAHALIAKQKAELDRIAAEADVPVGWKR